jgi:hypothetical protein
MPQQWFTSRDGREAGPFTPAELKRQAEVGQLQPTDLVRRADKSEWVPASSIRGLFARPPTPSEAPPQPSVPEVSEPTSVASGTTPTDGAEEEVGNVGDRGSVGRVKPQTLQSKWQSLSAGAKAGIIGGGCGLLFLFLVCAGVVGMVTKSTAPKTEDGGGAARKSSSSSQQKAGHQESYDKGFEDGYADLELLVKDYNQRKGEWTKTERDHFLKIIALRLKSWEDYHKELVDVLATRGELNDPQHAASLQFRRGMVDGAKKAIKDGGIR